MLSETLVSYRNTLHGVTTQKTTTSVFRCHAKDEVVPVLFLTEHHVMKAYWGVEL